MRHYICPFSALSLKSSMYFVLRTHINLYLLQFQQLTSTCGWWLLYWAAQAQAPHRGHTGPAWGSLRKGALRPETGDFSLDTLLYCLNTQVHALPFQGNFKFLNKFHTDNLNFNNFRPDIKIGSFHHSGSKHVKRT